MRQNRQNPSFVIVPGAVKWYDKFIVSFDFIHKETAGEFFGFEQNRAVHAIDLSGITKTFGPVVANKDISLNVRWGEILALLGENGSGKTTLMNILSGIYYPDSGTIRVNGKGGNHSRARDAF